MLLRFSLKSYSSNSKKLCQISLPTLYFICKTNNGNQHSVTTITSKTVIFGSLDISKNRNNLSKMRLVSCYSESTEYYSFCSKISQVLQWGTCWNERSPFWTLVLILGYGFWPFVQRSEEQRYRLLLESTHKHVYWSV